MIRYAEILYPELRIRSIQFHINNKQTRTVYSAFFGWFILSCALRNFLWESQDLIDRLMFYVFIFCSLGQRTFLTNNYSITRSRPLHCMKQDPWILQLNHNTNYIIYYHNVWLEIQNLNHFYSTQIIAADSLIIRNLVRYFVAEDTYSTTTYSL